MKATTLPSIVTAAVSALLWSSALVPTVLGRPNIVFIRPNGEKVEGVIPDGSRSKPYTDFDTAIIAAKEAGGGQVRVLSGPYELAKTVKITATANATAPVEIRPQKARSVTFDVTGRSGFQFTDTAGYLTLKGFELYGATDKIDFWNDIVARAFWGDSSVARGGGLAVILDGHHLTVKENYIHDFYQKAVEIRDGRYVKVHGNIIHNIATSSISGGHGIMRQQKGIEFTDDDVYENGFSYRWDIKSNLIFNVEQRIYSWVPSKGFIEMVIDEGKSILIDDPKDTDGRQEMMRARIMDNIVAFGSLVHIRIKSTPNLKVAFNTVYSSSPTAEGITDKTGDTDTPKFTNFFCTNNAVHIPGKAPFIAIEIDDAIGESTAAMNWQQDAAGKKAVVRKNYAVGLTRPLPEDQKGMIMLAEGTQLFQSPEEGNFTIHEDLDIRAGARKSTLRRLATMANRWSVPVRSDNVIIDHLKITQSILDNAPGVNDGVADNENIVRDEGVMNGTYETIKFRIVNGEWKDKFNSPDTQTFHLPAEYTTWYAGVAAMYPDAGRIRWGDSEIRQNQVLASDGVLVAKVGGGKVNAPGHMITLDGTLLVDLDGSDVESGSTYDFVVADMIMGMFDTVDFTGGVAPQQYTLSIVDEDDKQVLRLTIG